MRRRALFTAVSAALMLGSVQASAGKDVAQSPENRFFVIGENSEYFRPGMPRPDVPANKDAEVYFLREKLRLLERKLAVLEQRTAESEADPSAPATSDPLESLSGRSTAVPHELPAPIAYPAATRTRPSMPAKKPNKAAVSPTPTYAVVPLPELPPLTLASVNPGELFPSAEPPLPVLPSFPPPRAELVTFPAAPATDSGANVRGLDRIDDRVIEAAREIMESARERVSALIATVAPGRRAAAVQEITKPRNVVRGQIVRLPDAAAASTMPPVPPASVLRKEWVILYRLRNEQVSKQVASKLDAYRIPIGSREFLGGEYLMEVGVFEDEARARTRVKFLGYVVGVEPELRVRAVADSTSAGVRS